MLERILPRNVDNTYRGHGLALWLFAAVLLMKGVIGVNTIFNGREVAVSADAIPLDAYAPACARAFVSMAAAWALAQLTITLPCVLVLFRYRALLAFAFALLLLEHLCRRLLFTAMPIERSGTPPGLYVNLIATALMAVGLALSLRGRGGRRAKG